MHDEQDDFDQENEHRKDRDGRVESRRTAIGQHTVTTCSDGLCVDVLLPPYQRRLDGSVVRIAI